MLSLAQEKKEINIKPIIIDALTKHLDKDLLGHTPKDFVYLFSITLSFNEFGKIDSVYFPKSISKNVSEVMKLNAELVRKIKSKNLAYKQYATKLVFIPLMYKRVGNTGINYDSGFLTAIENLLPNINTKVSKKTWINLDFTIVPFSLHTN